MRKTLLVLVVLILFAFNIYVVINGLQLNNLSINSVTAISEENSKLDSKIQSATQLKENNYIASTKKLNKTYNDLMNEKEKYEEMLALGVDENGETLNKIQEYEIEKIWIAMGNHAKAEGVELKLDVTSNNSISKTYDLTFTASGGYIQIQQFIRAVDNDSTLVFKIENFKMVPSSEGTSVLVAQFVCKNIKVNLDKTDSMNEATPTEEENSINKVEKNPIQKKQ